MANLNLGHMWPIKTAARIVAKLKHAVGMRSYGSLININPSEQSQARKCGCIKMLVKK